MIQFTMYMLWFKFCSWSDFHFPLFQSLQIYDNKDEKKDHSNINPLVIQTQSCCLHLNPIAIDVADG